MKESLAFGWMIKRKEHAPSKLIMERQEASSQHSKRKRTVRLKHLQRSEFGLNDLKAHKPSHLTNHR